MKILSYICCFAFFYVSARGEDIVAYVKRAPSINGAIYGSIHQLNGENVQLNGGAIIEGNWLLPGTPTIRVNGNVEYGGASDGTGATAPSGYLVTLNGGASLGNIVRRTDPIAFPSAQPFVTSTGTKSVVLSKSGGYKGNFTQLRNLTLQGKAGVISIPPGNYGSFIANDKAGFVFGVPGSESYSIYRFDNLTLNSHSKVQIVGPVILVVKSSLTLNSHVIMGNATHPNWLSFESNTGDLRLNAQSQFYGQVIVPNSEVVINAQSELLGQVWSSRLTINAQGILRYFNTNGDSDNHDPIAHHIDLQVVEDSQIAFQLSGSDVDGDALTYLVVDAPTNGVLAGTAPDLTYTPNADFNGFDRLTYWVSDGIATSAVAVVEITVTPVNDVPVADPQSLTTEEDQPLALILSGSDVDGDALTYWVVDMPTNGTLSGTVPNLTYTPNADFNGFDRLTYWVSDGIATSTVANVEITVTSVNDVPVADPQSLTTEEDQPLTLILSGSDVDGDALTYLVVDAPTNGVLAGTAPDLTYTPNANYNGFDRLTYWVSDGIATSAVAVVEITVTPVNDVPVADPLSLTTAEDQPLTLILSGSDVDGDALTYLVIDAPTNGTLSGTVPNLTYSPALNYYGQDRFSFTATDGLQTSLVAWVTLNVLSVNDAPFFVAENPPVITYIDGAQSVANWAVFNSGASNEAQNATYVVTNVTGSTHFLSLPSVASDGTLNYEITNGVIGTYSFDLYVTDDGGVERGGIDTSSIQTFNIVVEEAANSAPEVNAGEDQSNDFVIIKGTNLVINPGAENDPQVGWTSIDSTQWQSVDGSKVTAFEGNRSFYPGLVASGEIYQDVDLSAYAAAIDAGRQEFSFRAAIQSKDELRPDYASVEVQFWGEDLLDVHTFSPEQPSEGIWLVLSGKYIPPAGTRFVRIRLIAERKLSDNSCDTWFDGIEFCPLTYPAVLLNGTVSDDGLPWNSQITHEWTLSGGNHSAVDILTPLDKQTFIVFKEAGIYEFLLSADDTELTGEDRVRIEWNIGSGNQPPRVDAGPDAAITLPTNRVHLAGVITDDGLPSSNSLHSVWVLEDGPAEIFFDDQSAADTFVYFREAGTYVLRLNASDGELSSSDSVTVTVNCGITPIDLGIAIDHSGSMGGATSPGSKLYLARQSARRLLTQMSPVHDQGCLASLDRLTTGMSADFEYLEQTVNQITSGGGASQTDLGIGFCFNEILDNGRSNVTPIIIALADGQSHGYANAAAAKAAGMRVITVGYGTDVDDDHLRELASSPSDYYFVGQLEDIDAAFESIGRTICRYVNEAPHVYIKEPVVFAKVGESVPLDGYVHDDGVPVWDTLTYEWSLNATSGTIVDTASLRTAVSFNQKGKYVVDLIANDGLKMSIASKTVIVEESCGVAIPAGLISYWPLDRSAQDMTGRNSGVADWIHSSEIVFGTHFDGSALKIPESSSLDVGAENGFSLEFWMKPDSVVSTVDVLGWNKDVCIIRSTTQIYVKYKTDSSSGSISSGAVLSTNAWTHVGVVFDNRNNLLMLYINGKEVTNRAVDGDILTGEQFSMGVISGNPYLGALDDVALYDRALSFVDIYEQFAAGRGGKCLTIGNQAPFVDAGSDRLLSRDEDALLLQGNVSDDGQPYGILQTEWKQLHGPAETSFENSTESVTTAHFPTSGVYILQLSADDGYAVSRDTVTVKVGLSCEIDVKNDVISWWRANGNFEDETGLNPAMGTLFGDGISGGAFRFDGRNMVRIPDASGLNVGTNAAGFSYECWIRPDSNVGTEFLLGWSGATYLRRSSQTLQAYYRPVGSSSTYISASSTLSSNNWTHAMAVFNNEADTYTLYVNGVPIISATVTTNLVTTEDFTMGSGFKGQLDEIAVYNRAMTREEVATLYAVGAEGKCIDAQNEAPVVNAGADAVAGVGQSVLLNGSVADDGKPYGTLKIEWQKLFGPGDVQFGNKNLPVSSAQFSAVGVYTLQLTANDGYRTSSDIVEVHVDLACDYNITSDVISWWRANGDFEDELGLNPATGILFGEGVSGGAFRFVGNNVVRIPDALGLNVGTNAAGFSYECWIRPDSNSGNEFLLGWSGSTYLRRSSQTLQAYYRPVGSSATYISASTALSSNSWTHALAVFDNAANVYTLYVNGVPIASAAVTTNLITTTEFVMGSGYKGRLDEVAVYNRALTREEVASLYAAGAEGKCIDAQNEAPVVDAGADAVARIGQSLMLNGSVADDGKPYGTLEIQWQKLYGPADVLFENSALPVTSAQFSTPGLYTLQLTANDGYRTSSDIVEVQVDLTCDYNMASDVISWWRANGDFADETGLNHAIGTLFGEGVSGGAFRFVGNNMVRIQTASGLNVGTNATGFSYECWIRPDSNSGNEFLLGWSGTTYLYRSSQHLYAYYQPGGTSTRNIIAYNVLNSNSWTHAMAVFDNAADTYMLYVNGVPAASVAVTTNLVTTGTFSMGSGYKGRLDEVAVYNRALTREEVAEIYAAGADGKCIDSANEAPAVDAGNDAKAEVGQAIALNGSVSDDGLPYGSLDIQWTKLFGPGEVVFGNSRLPVTTAQFSTSGVYALQLTADDGYRTSSDIMEVQVDLSCDYNMSADVISWWRANGDFADETGLNLAAGTLFGDGLSGGAFRFEGNNVVRIPEQTGLNVGTNATGFSYECWIRPDSNSSGWENLVGWAGATDLRRAGQTLYAYYQPEGASTRNISASYALSSNSWTHAMAVFDNEADTYMLYVNGVPAASVAVTTNLVTTGTFSMGSGYKGRLDEVAVYNRALTREEVAEIYAAGADGKCIDSANEAPAVDAGNDAKAEVGQAIALNGSVSDDGLPYGSLDIQWTKLFGPDEVSFGNSRLPVTTAQFSTSGVYVLQLTADDGYRTSSDIMEVQVDLACDYNISPDVISWWRANGDFADETDLNPATGTLFGDGLSGGSFRFDGSNVVRIPQQTGLNVGTNAAGFSYECWIRPDSNSGSEFLLGWSGSTYLQRISQHLYAYYRPADSSTRNISVNYVLDTNRWTHAVAVFDNGADTYTLYVNGLPAASAAVPTTLVTTETFSMGSGYKGRLDEVAVYNRALTREEVAEIYAAGADGKCHDPLNEAPVVSAGLDATLEEVGFPVMLNGSVSDDGLPFGLLDIQWVKVFGPGEVSFGNSRLPVTTAQFSTSGVYVLELMASDGSQAASDRMTVRVDVPCLLDISEDAISLWHANGSFADETGRNPAAGNLFGDGISGGAFRFDGSNVVRIPAPQYLDQGTNPDGFSIDFWAKRDASSHGGRMVSWGTVTGLIQWGDRIDLYGRTVEGQNRTSYNYSVFPADQWVHVGMVFNNTNDVMECYVNGVLKGTVAVTGDLQTTADFVIGKDYKGLIDELAVYRHALTAQEMQDLYAAGAYGKCVTAPYNLAPVVDAGTDITQAFGEPLQLRAHVEDDGFPLGAVLEFEWAIISGSGKVNFSNPYTLDPIAMFDTPGEYILGILVSDSNADGYDEISVLVEDDDNQILTVDAGDDRITTNDTINLSGDINDESLSKGLQAYYPFSGNANDESGNGHDGVVISADLCIGRYGDIDSAYEFNGSNGYINCANVISNFDEFTVSAWTKIETDSNDQYMGPWGQQYFGNYNAIPTNSYCMYASYNPTKPSFGTLMQWDNGELIDTRMLRFGNHIVNGAFSDGIEGFESDYNYALKNNTQRQYFVGDDPIAWNSWHPAKSAGWLDKSLSDDNLALFVDGSTLATGGEGGNLACWRQTVTNLIAGNDYVFSGWVFSFGVSPGNLRVDVDGQRLLEGFEMPPENYGWVPFRVFMTATDSSAVIEIKDNSMVANGNDFALDDLQLTRSPWVLVTQVYDGEEFRQYENGRLVNSVVSPNHVLHNEWDFLIGKTASYNGTVTSNHYFNGLIDEVRVYNRALSDSEVLSLHKEFIGDEDVSKVQWSLVSGPAAVIFSNPYTLNSTASFPAPGVYVLKLTVSYGSSVISDEITITVTDGDANTAPVVNVGEDLEVSLSEQLMLKPFVTDDGRTTNALTFVWSALNHTSNVVFNSSNAMNTAVSFSATGNYRLQLTVSDGQYTTKDDLLVSVLEDGANRAPTVYAGTDRRISYGQTCVLTPTVQDDGLPTGTINVLWQPLNQTGLVHIANADTLNAEVSFDAVGAYQLQLTATDGERAASDVMVIYVQEANNNAPVVDAGVDVTVAGPVQMNPRVYDDGLPYGSTLSYAWQQVSGPTVSFSDSSTSNVVVSFPADGQYTLELAVSDSELVSRDTVIITVDTGLNTAPLVDAGTNQTVSIDTGAWLQGHVVDDGLPTPNLDLYWYLQEGPTNYVVTTNALTSTNVWIGFEVPGDYTMMLYASDGHLYGMDTVTVTVVESSITNQAPAVDAGAAVTITTTTYPLRPTVSDDGLPKGRLLDYTWSIVRGPANITITDIQVLNPIVTFSAGGLYELKLTVSDGEFAISDTIEIVVDLGNNMAPVVELGDDKTISIDDTVVLEGMVTDDGQPSGTLAYNWYMVSGPTNYLRFKGPLDTSRIELGFVQTGDYTMMLRASDGELAGSDTVTVTVTDGAGINRAPRIDAGVDTTISSFAVQLNPYVEDDGLPVGSTLTYAWSVIQGAGRARLDDATVKQPIVTFDAAGTYLFQLVVSDGDLSAVDTTTIIVDVGANRAPVVDVGDDLIVTLADGANLSATVTDDGLPSGTLSYNWYFIDGPSDRIYAYEPLTKTNIWVGFEVPGIYTMALYAFDGQQYGYDSLKIDVRAAPVLQITSPTNYQSVADGELLQLTATAQDADGSVASVEFFVDDISVGISTNEPFSVSMTNALSDGIHTAYALGTDNEGNLGQSSNVLFTVGDEVIEPVWAEFVYPTNNQVVTQPISVTGTVESLVFDEWTLYYRELRSSNDGEWIELNRGNNTGENIEFGRFDPTLLQNGFYELGLRAVDQLGYVIVPVVTVQVDGAMKIGAFSLAFEDVKVPVAGVPMTVTRMYDSRDKKIGDFGYGWNLGVSQSIRLRKNRNFGKDWYGDTFEFSMFYDYFKNTGYILDTAGDRIVTINLADGTTYKFKAYPNIKENLSMFSEWPDNYRWAGGPFNYGLSTIEFRPMDGTYGELIALDKRNNVNQSTYAATPTGWFDLLSDRTGELWNPTRFKLITEDGTELILDEERGLIRMEDKNGSWLEIDEDGVVHSSGQTLRFVRNDKGIITEVVDPAGQSLKYRYDEFDRLIEFENRAGEVTEYFYEIIKFPHYLTRIVDPLGNNAIRTEYDDEGRVVSQIDADGHAITFEHAVDDNMEIITDRLGRQTVHVYNESGQVVESIQYLDGREIVTRREYDGYGRETKVIDPLGHETEKVYGPEKNQVLQEFRRAPNGAGGFTESVSSNVYDEDGNLTAMTDFGGKTTHMGYDSVGNLTAMTDAAGNTQQFAYSGGNLTRITDAGGNVTEMGYDASGNRISRLVKNPSSYMLEYQTFQYDKNGNETNTVDYLIPANSRYTSQAVRYRETHTTYDAENRQTGMKIFDANGVLKMETGTAYNALGKKSAETNALGLVTRYVYDSVGNLIETRFPDGRVENQYYDLENRLLQVETVSSNQVVLTRESYAYNELDHKVRVTQLDGSYTESEYDDIGRVTAEFDALGTPTLFEYDPTCACGGRRTAVVDALGNRMEYTYDESGNQVTATDANGHQTFFYHDELGRQTNVVMYGASASVPLSSTFTEYDAMGRRSAEVDAMGVRKLYGYDALGRLSSVTQYLNRQALVTKYTYDSLGRMLTQTDAENHTTTFEYDVLGRRTARILPGNQRETYTYDAVGNMLTHTDFNGHTTTYEYDSFGRPVAEVADPAHPSLALAHAPARVEYVYDVRGNRVTERLLNASGVEIHADRFAFDSTGQMAWHHSSYEDNSFAHLFDYGRDAAGNLTNILSSTAGGASTVLTYDELNRLSKVYVQDGGVIEPAIASYTYDNVGSLSAVNYANGIEHAYTYNALNRLTNLTHWVTDPVSSLKSQVSSYAYTLDARGYRTEILEASGRESHYTYDTLGRLTREYLMGDPTVLNGASDYTYDKVGNRLSRTSSGFMPANQDFTYNENDWLDSDTYDSNGNTILSDVTQQGTNVASNVADVYDFRNRLIRRTYDSGLILDYSYNARGTRIGKAKRIGGTIVNRKLFVVDDQNLTGYVQTLEEWTAAGFDAVVLDKVYDYGLDLIAQTAFKYDAVTPNNLTPKTSYYLYDGHGSVRALADESGTITDTYTYDAFGIQLSQQVLNTTTGEMEQLSIGNLHSAIDNAYRYCGEYYDSDLGLYYLRARHMNPETGRFHTLDTYEGRLGEPLSLHKYMYVHANPVMGTDPSGEFFSLIELAATRVIEQILRNADNESAFVKLRMFTSRLCALAGRFAGAYSAVRSKLTMFIPGRKNKVFEAHHVLMGAQMAKLFKNYSYATAFAIPLLGGTWAKHSPHGAATRYQQRFKGKYADNPLRLAKGALRAAGCSKIDSENLVQMAADWDHISDIVQQYSIIGY